MMTDLTPEQQTLAEAERAAYEALRQADAARQQTSTARWLMYNACKAAGLRWNGAKWVVRDD